MNENLSHSVMPGQGRPDRRQLHKIGSCSNDVRYQHGVNRHYA